MAAMASSTSQMKYAHFRFLFALQWSGGILPGEKIEEGRQDPGLAAAIITGLRLARDPRAGCKTQRVIDAVEDGIFLANQIYEGSAALRPGTLISNGELEQIGHRLNGRLDSPLFLALSSWRGQSRYGP